MRNLMKMKKGILEEADKKYQPKNIACNNYIKPSLKNKFVRNHDLSSR